MELGIFGVLNGFDIQAVDFSGNTYILPPVIALLSLDVDAKRPPKNSNRPSS